MQITSERLSFCKCIPSDYADFEDLVMREEVMRYITGKGLRREEAEERFAGNLRTNAEDPSYGFFMARNKQNEQLIGYGKLVRWNETQYEAGYSLHPDYWGQGYASEILKALILYAREDPGITDLVAMIAPANLASRKVLEKQAFTSYKLETNEKGETEYFRLKLR